MRTLTVALPGRNYEIQIQRGLLARAGARFRAALPRAERIFLVTDDHVAPLYLDRVQAGLTAAGFRTEALVLPAGEETKCPARLAQLWEEMMAFGLTRTDAVAALGGRRGGGLGGLRRRHGAPGGGLRPDPHHPPRPGGLLRGGQGGR